MHSSRRRVLVFIFVFFFLLFDPISNPIRLISSLVSSNYLTSNFIYLGYHFFLICLFLLSLIHSLSLFLLRCIYFFFFSLVLSVVLKILVFLSHFTLLGMLSKLFEWCTLKSWKRKILRNNQYKSTKKLFNNYFKYPLPN